MKSTSATVRFLVCALILFSTHNVFSQKKETTLDSVKDTAVLLRKIKKVMEQDNIPGLMISIVKGDSILYAGGLGYADIEKKIPVGSGTLFHQNSITKMFTAMGILKLVKEGRLKLNDELKVIAPEIKFQNE